jgi:hypothetical protein
LKIALMHQDGFFGFLKTKIMGLKNYHDNHWPFYGISNTETTLVSTSNVNFHKCFDLYMLTKKVI